jgi:hypothetical protein
MAASKNSKNSRLSNSLATLACFAIAAAVMAAAVSYFYRAGVTLYYGDAEAHLDIARRIVDSRTPGWSQVGTTWLPLPHLLMLPFVRDNYLWSTGLAGAYSSAICISFAATFLFAALRRIFDSTIAAAGGAAVFLLNPNTLYLGSIPMTEPAFFASLFALLFFTVRFGETRGWGALLGASIAALAGTLTRYEAWVLLPFVALYILISGPRARYIKNFAAALVFCLIAVLGPALWLAHNRWYFGDPLYFYRGPWSALAIQGNAPYPGKGEWFKAAHYFLEAGHLVAGIPALIIAALGTIFALTRRAVWPALLLTLPPLFYIWSIHSSGNPIFVPTLYPNSWYNTRYAMAFLPLAAFGAAALSKLAKPVAPVLVLLASLPFLIKPSEHSITWQESDRNSRTRRESTARTARFLKAVVGPHDTFITSFGELTGVFRTLGIPIRDTLTGDNDVVFALAMTRPDIFLNTEWAVVTGGDEIQTMIDRARLNGPRYEIEGRIMVKGSPVIEIYRRKYEDPLYKAPWSEERLPSDVSQ